MIVQCHYLLHQVQSEDPIFSTIRRPGGDCIPGDCTVSSRSPSASKYNLTPGQLHSLTVFHSIPLIRARNLEHSERRTVNVIAARSIKNRNDHNTVVVLLVSRRGVVSVRPMIDVRHRTRMLRQGCIKFCGAARAPRTFLDTLPCWGVGGLPSAVSCPCNACIARLAS